MFHHISRGFVAAAATLACMTAVAASSALDLSSGSAGLASTPPAGAFEDSYTFILSSDSFLSGSITTTGIAPQVVDIEFVSFNDPSGRSLAFTPVLPFGFETWVFGGFVSAGDFSLTVVGTNGPARGTYAGVVSVSPSVPVVPEPESLALMGGGLALLALAVRRRRNTD